MGNRFIKETNTIEYGNFDGDFAYVEWDKAGRKYPLTIKSAPFSLPNNHPVYLFPKTWTRLAWLDRYKKISPLLYLSFRLVFRLKEWLLFHKKRLVHN